MSAMLQVESVRQEFRSGFWMKRVEILHGVSLQVPKGTIFGFLGANGAGKTTLISLIVGIRKATSGKVLIDGIDAQSPLARAKIGYLPERPFFHEHLTGEGLLNYFGALSGMEVKACRVRIPEVLEIVGMGHARKLELRKYSKGMLQRIGIAQAILHDPDFLVLDEPMSGLDPVGRKEVRELIIKLASEGKTIFFSSHVIPDVEAICDQVAMIQKGVLVGAGPIEDFLRTGAAGVEIVFSGIDLPKARSLPCFSSLRQNLDSIRATVDAHQAVSDALRSLLDLGSRIHSVTPVRPSLESFFLEGSAR